MRDWHARFGQKLGLRCIELTGDTDATDAAELDCADIICTTPEKFGELPFGISIGLIRSSN